MTLLGAGSAALDRRCAVERRRSEGEGVLAAEAPIRDERAAEVFPAADLPRATTRGARGAALPTRDDFAAPWA